ncbi:MAG: Smr/MutS family protein [Polyangiaceae bacterium]|nr:Smr/MutS family protein [Polyangiaceae bacterium]
MAEQRSKRRATPPLPDAVSADNPGDDTDDGSGGSDVAVVPIEESIDLHFFAPRDVPSVVEEYLREAHARGFAEVRIIHGRGKGVQRRRVHKILEGHALVGSFRSDGLGSTVVVFRRGSRG